MTIAIGAILDRVIIALVFEQRLTVNPSFESPLETILAAVFLWPIFVGIHNLLNQITLPVKRFLKIDWTDENLTMNDINEKGGS
jgi:hypothetical protein